jgi:hypothetical protein
VPEAGSPGQEVPEAAPGEREAGCRSEEPGVREVGCR